MMRLLILAVLLFSVDISYLASWFMLVSIWNQCNVICWFQFGIKTLQLATTKFVSASKKLPCNHIFHTSCLRSWFQRQQTCPTCRLNILRAPGNNQSPTQPPPPRARPEQQQPPPPRPDFQWGVPPPPPMGTSINFFLRI